MKKFMIFSAFILGIFSFLVIPDEVRSQKDPPPPPPPPRDGEGRSSGTPPPPPPSGEEGQSSQTTPPSSTEGVEGQSSQEQRSNLQNLVSPTKQAATKMEAAMTAGVGLTLISPGVKSDNILPFSYTCDGLGVDEKRGGLSPALTFSNAPQGTVSFAVTMHVLKGREKEVESIWTLYNIPASVISVPEGNTDIGTLGLSERGEASYFAPCSKDPILNSYTLTLYALPKMLDLDPADATYSALTSQAEAAKLESTTLVLTNVRYNPDVDADLHVPDSVPVSCEEKSVPFAAYDTTSVACDSTTMTVTSKTGFPPRSALDGDKLNVGIESWIGRVPVIHNTTWKIPLTPRYLAAPEDNILIHFPTGITVDGIPILHYAKESSRDEVAKLGTDYSDRDTALLGEIDQCGGHAGNGDDYHYHYAPLCMMDSHDPSQPLAFMVDGIPLFFGTAGGNVEGSTSVNYGAGRYSNLDYRPHAVKSGSESLDECNAYDLNGDGAGSGYVYYTSKEPPYTIGCFRGEANQEESAYHYPRWNQPRDLSWSGSGVLITDYYRGQFEGKTWYFMEMIAKDRSQIGAGKIGLVLYRQLESGDKGYIAGSSCWIFRYRLDSSDITGSNDTTETQCQE